MSYREEPGILCSLFQHLAVSKNYYVFNLQDVLWDNVKCHVLQHHCCGFQNEKNCAMDREQYMGIHVDTDDAWYICNEGIHRAFCLVVANLCSTSLKK